ncbi:FliH/SctL family protein [Desulfolithobacter sp.]
MSSSKIFKDDPAFTPITLISEEITPDKATVVQQAPEPNVQEEDSLVREDPVDNREEAPEPSPSAPVPPPEPVDVEKIRQEAYQQGQDDARQEMQLRFENSLKALAETCRQLDDLHGNLLNGSRGEVINVVIALTRKILGRELATRRDVIASTLEAALEAAIASDEYLITLHPDDLALAEEMHPSLVASIRGLNHIVFKTDPDITPGGCLIESNLCSVDATIESQLEAAREFLEEQAATDDEDAGPEGTGEES